MKVSRPPAKSHSASLRSRWHCRRAAGNVANIQCCQYQFPISNVDVLKTCPFFNFIFDLYLKLAIGNIGNGNTSLLSTLAIRSNPVGDTKKGEGASCLFQRDKSGVVERGCAGAADVGGKFIEGEALGAGDGNAPMYGCTPNLWRRVGWCEDE